jgi:hypothetical protein
MHCCRFWTLASAILSSVDCGFRLHGLRLQFLYCYAHNERYWKMWRASELRKSTLFLAQSAHDINVYKRTVLIYCNQILVWSKLQQGHDVPYFSQQSVYLAFIICCFFSALYPIDCNPLSFRLMEPHHMSITTSTPAAAQLGTSPPFLHEGTKCS